MVMTMMMMMMMMMGRWELTVKPHDFRTVTHFLGSSQRLVSPTSSKHHQVSLRKSRIEMLEIAEQERNALEKDKQELLLGGRDGSISFRSPTMLVSRWFSSLAWFVCKLWLWGCCHVMWWWMAWWLVDATSILMKSLIREQRIKTIQSEEQDKDSLAREKLELMLQNAEDQKEALEKEKQEMLLVFDS